MKSKKTIITIIIIVAIIIIGAIIFMKNKNDTVQKQTTKSITSSATVKNLSSKETKGEETLSKFSKLLEGNSFISIDFSNKQSLIINTKNPQVVNNHIMLTGYYTDGVNTIKKEYKYNVYANGSNSFKIIESYNNIEGKTMNITIDAKNKLVLGGYSFKYSLADTSASGILAFGAANEYPFYNGIYKNKKFSIFNENDVNGTNNAFTLIYNNESYTIGTPFSVNLDLNNLVLFKNGAIAENEKRYYKLNIKKISKDSYEISFTKDYKVISVKITGSYSPNI